jgi:hypothetical protein
MEPFTRGIIWELLDTRVGKFVEDKWHTVHMLPLTKRQTLQKYF